VGLNVGDTVPLHGDVTPLVWVGPRPRLDVERNLGYRSGRLEQGYWLAVLISRLAPGDFELSGTTLRSGGRLGAPEETTAADNRRKRVRDDIRERYGDAGYQGMKSRLAAMAALTGQDRLCKVIPVTAHAADMRPKDQYPMGGGGLQWTINKPPHTAEAKSGPKFYIAAFFGPDFTVQTPHFTVSLDERQRADTLLNNRTPLMQYFRIAPARLSDR